MPTFTSALRRHPALESWQYSLKSSSLARMRLFTQLPYSYILSRSQKRSVVLLMRNDVFDQVFELGTPALAESGPPHALGSEVLSIKRLFALFY